MSERPQVVIISGTSASGKTTLVERLLREDPRFRRVVTATSRAPRPGEVHGVHYYFLSPEEVEHLQGEDGFIESATVYGAFKGVPRFALDVIRDSGAVPVLILDIQGVRNFKEKLGTENVFGVFVAPDLSGWSRVRWALSTLMLSAHMRQARYEEAVSEMVRARILDREPDLLRTNPSELESRVRTVISEIQEANRMLESGQMDLVLPNPAGGLERTFAQMRALLAHRVGLQVTEDSGRAVQGMPRWMASLGVVGRILYPSHPSRPRGTPHR